MCKKNEDRVYSTWQKGGLEKEQEMEDGHKAHWKKIVAVLKRTDFENKKVLDFGCNQGGFLRYLYETFPFEKGVGIDLSTQSIAVANERKNNLPLEYFNTGSPESLGTLFDTAISSSVIYLINDLDAHAKKIKDALKPQGVYYIQYTDYNGDPNLPKMKKEIDSSSHLTMNLHSLDDIATTFEENGFEVSILRILPTDYIPIQTNDPWFLRVSERIHCEYNEIYMFRMVHKQVE